ncbi:hypothetical protein LSAT2_016470 [Lamellibrachia satsuma]|nr:hypothetical protein LSAT2_016470 [Lamellibrachia satsuma]
MFPVSCYYFPSRLGQFTYKNPIRLGVLWDCGWPCVLGNATIILLSATKENAQLLVECARRDDTRMLLMDTRDRCIVMRRLTGTDMDVFHENPELTNLSSAFQEMRRCSAASVCRDKAPDGGGMTDIGQRMMFP